MTPVGTQPVQSYTREARSDLVRAIAGLVGAGSRVEADVPLSSRTTLRVGGPADCFLTPESEEDLSRAVAWCDHHRIPWMVLGRGSNLLVRDGGIEGLVIHLNHPFFHRIENLGDNRLLCGAGSRLRQVANAARDHSIGGLEFLEGIPGSVGGALRMNAGAMGGEIFDFLNSFRFLDSDGTIHELDRDQVDYHYRSCPMLVGHVALSAVLTGTPSDSDSIRRRMKQSNEKRWSSQPAAPSAGCTFKNPARIPAGKLIEELGLKGASIGGARVSEVHGNFMVNDGTARAADFLQLIHLIQESARTRAGIELHTEVQIVGVEP